MSFREKSAWACVLTTLAVFVPYFVYVFWRFGHEELGTISVTPEFVAAVVFAVLLNIGVHIAIALRSRLAPKDERDRAIEATSFRNAYYVLLCCVGVIVFTPLPWLNGTRTLALMNQVLLACFVVAEATWYLTQAVCYRRGS